MSRVGWITLAIVAGSIAIAALLLNGTKRESVAIGGETAAEVEVLEVRATALPGEVRCGGFLRARADVTLSAERAGRVLSFPVAEGGAVAAGAVVVHLDDTASAAELERARAAAREAELDPHTPAAQLEAAQAALAVARHEQALRHPVSPLAGVVEVQHVDAGEYVRPGQPLVDVIDPRVLILDAEVDAGALGSVRPGMAVPLAVTELGGAGAAEGRVRRVAARASESTRRFRIEVEVEVGAGALRPGMHAEARLALPPGAPAFYVPKSATRTVRAEVGVFVVEEGRARWKALRVEEVFARPDLWRVVGNGLRDGASVVVSGFSGLRDGAPVVVGS